MMLRRASAVDGIGAGLAGAAGFALGYLTPIGGIIVVLLVGLLIIDALSNSAGQGLSSVVARGLGKLAKAAWSPIDKASSSPMRLWLWRGPGIATLAGFLLAWAQNLSAGAA
jgi:hypothetical protein